MSFEPESGFAEDTLRILCGNISINPENYSVKFNDEDANILSIADSVIMVVVPAHLQDHESIISVSLFSRSSSFTDPYYLKVPVLNSFSPLEVFPGGEVVIEGSDFPPNDNNLKIYFNETLAAITGLSPAEIRVLAPPVPNQMNIIKIWCSNQVAESDTEIRVIIPSDPIVSPNSGIYGDQVYIIGEGIDSYDIQNLQIGGVIIKYFNTYDNALSFIIPDILANCESSVIITYEGGSFTTTNTFNLIPPEISGFDISEVRTGKALTVYGQNFSPDNSVNNVSIGGIVVDPISSSTSSVVFTVPGELEPGDYNVGVSTCGDFVFSSTTVKVKKPVFIRLNNFIGGAVFSSGSFSLDGDGYVGLGYRRRASLPC